MIELAFYGSFARDRGSDDSAVDILIRFDSPSREVRAETRFYVEREAIDV